MGFEALVKEFEECCELYRSTEKCIKKWLWIPEMMHVIASLNYTKPVSKRVNVDEMKQKWREIVLMRKTGKVPTPVPDTPYVDDD